MTKRELKIMVVDDEEEFAATLVERLEMRRFSTLLANNGDDAVGVIEKEKPAVVVLDVLMPGTSGIDVLRWIKRKYPEIQVILLTGHGSTRDGIRGMQLGAFDYLMKPVDIDDLIKKMDEAFEIFEEKNGHQKETRVGFR